MKFRLSLILSIFLLVVTPILLTGIVTMQAAEKALVNLAWQNGIVIEQDDLEIQRVQENIIYMLIIGAIVSLAGAGVFTGELALAVNRIKEGLEGLSHDSQVRIKSLPGVLGEIVAAINKMADKLAEAQNHRDALLYSSPNGILTVDQTGKLILFNPAAAALTGVQPEQALEKDFREIQLPPSLIQFLETVLAPEKTILTREVTFNRSDGRLVTVAVTASQLYDDRQEIVGALLVMIDLREIRLLEAQVLQANRLAGLGELAAGVAHEIRNPLTAIKGYTQVLEEELPLEDEKREYTGVIVKEVNRLDRIVRELLTFARPSQSCFQSVKLNGVLEETLVLINHSSFHQRIKFVKICAEEIELEADPDQLKQIILNLLLNAAQAIPDQGEIRVLAQSQGEWVQIRFQDNGVGIPKENLEKLFDPFFTTREQGTGLGLAMVHQLVVLHRGKVDVQSEWGRGTEFKVSLPLRQGGEARE